MGSVTPLLDTLLHQIKGRQDALDAYVRPRLGTLPISAIDTFHDAGKASHETHSPPNANEQRDSREAFEAKMRHLQTDAGQDVAATSTRTMPRQEPVSMTGSSRLMLSQAAAALNEVLDQLPLASRPVDITSTLRLLAQQQPHFSSDTWSGELLHQAVARSGVFFEAHVARWREGAYSLDRLREESHQRELQADAGRQAQWGDDVVGQQIALLAGRPLRIQGEAWPAALFGLTLYPVKDDAVDEEHADPHPPVTPLSECHYATLTVETRRWGTVQLAISLLQGEVTFTIDSAAANNGERLERYSDRLSERLGQRGLASQLSFMTTKEVHNG